MFKYFTFYTLPYRFSHYIIAFACSAIECYTQCLWDTRSAMNVSNKWYQLFAKCEFWVYGIEYVVVQNSHTHTALWFSLSDVYRYQPISHSSCSWNYNVWWLCHVWLDRVRKNNSVHFSCDMSKCSPKASNLIHFSFPISHANEHCLHIFLHSHSDLLFSLWDVYRYQPISHLCINLLLAVTLMSSQPPIGGHLTFPKVAFSIQLNLH